MRKIYFKSERAHLCSPMAAIHIYADVTGHIDKNRLSDAIDMVTKMHPTLNATVEIDSDGKSTFVLDGERKNTPVWIEAKENTSIDDIICEYDRKPFDYQNGPLVRFVLLHKKDSFTLLINGHHILGDGLAYLQLLHDLLDALESPEGFSDGIVTEKMPKLPDKPDSLPSEGKLDPIPDQMFGQLNLLWSMNKHFFSQEEYTQMFYNFHEKNRTGVYESNIEPLKLERLKEFCHIHQITVNDALATAFIKAVQEVLPGRDGAPLRMGIAVNIRNDVKDYQPGSMGNYVSGIIISPKYDDRQSFSDNARLVSNEIHGLIQNPKARLQAAQLLLKMDDSLLDAFQFSAYSSYSNNAADALAKILGEGQPTRGIGFTNLGPDRLKFMNNKYTVTNVALICPASPSNDITMGALTYNGRLNLCFRFYENQNSKEQIIQVCNRIMQLLPE